MGNNYIQTIFISFGTIILFTVSAELALKIGKREGKSFLKILVGLEGDRIFTKADKLRIFAYMFLYLLYLHLVIQF